MVKKMSTLLLSALSLSLLSFGVLAAEPGSNCPPSFGSAQNEAVVVGAARSSMADFNQDGKADLITLDSDGVPSIRFKTENGFSDPVVSDYIHGIYRPAAMAVGYFDGDYVEGNFVANKWPDIVVATTSGAVHLLTSDAYGYFSFRGTPVMRGFYTALAAVDFNRDGMSDILAVDIAGGAVTFLSRGDGNWGDFAYTPTAAGAYAVGEVPISASVGYFDGTLVEGILTVNDGHDLAVLTNQGRVLLYTTDPQGYFTVREAGLVMSFAEVRTIDVNQDQRTDLLARDSAGMVYLLLRNENGDFTSPQPIGQEQVTSLIGAYDVNGDGNVDVATTSGADEHFAWFASVTALSCQATN